MTPPQRSLTARGFLTATRVTLAAGLLILALGAPALAAPTTFHVAPGGSDAWSGAIERPNADRSDGPLATLEGARDAIRRCRHAGTLSTEGAIVLVHGGTYELPRPLALSAEDGGTKTAPIVYRAAEGQDVRLSGGRRIRSFAPLADRAVLDRLEETARPHVVWVDLKAQGVGDFGSAAAGGPRLYFQNRPMTLARWPNEGFTRIVDVLKNQPLTVHGCHGDSVGKFVYDGDRPKRWIGENDAWLHGYWFWDWSDERQKIESIDPEKRTIAIAPPYHNYGYRKGQWYYAFNLLAELDSPGEWYLDRPSGILYFWPPTPVEKAEAVVSVLENLVTMTDTQYVVFQGLTFEAARGTAFVIRSGTGNRIADCTLRNLDGSAVSISGGTESGVEGCKIYQIGAGAIHLEGGDRATLTPAGHWATDNEIHDYGLWRRMYSAGVSLSGVAHRVAHNLIHSAPHNAILFSGNDHLIELNEIHHVCLESNDAGAIYAGRDWTMRGHVIRFNFLHDITGFRGDGCVGVYLDDMFCGTHIFGNVFYKVTRAAFIGGGRDNRVENNIFVDCEPALHADARALGWAAYHVDTTMKERLAAMPYTKPPWSTRYPELVNILQDEPAAPKGNVIRRNVCVGGRWDGIHQPARPYLTLADNLIGEPPGFVEAAKMDFRLRDDSPVYVKLPGFQKIPLDQIGPRR